MVQYHGFTWVQLLTLLVSVVLPALVALVTQRHASEALKALVLAFLAALTGFLSELLDALVHNNAYDVGAGVYVWVMSFVIAVAAHYGLLKPTRVTGRDGAIQAKTAYVGLGSGRHELRR